jgi:hypothetical protein
MARAIDSIKIIKSKRHTKIQVHTLVILCTWVLCSCVMRANPFRGSLEGADPRKARPKKVSIFRPTRSNGPRNGWGKEHYEVFSLSYRPPPLMIRIYICSYNLPLGGVERGQWWPTQMQQNSRVGWDWGRGLSKQPFVKYILEINSDK